MSSTKRLADKAVIVTGSTTGIGEAIARRFVAEGARVLVHGMERDLGERVVADLGAGNAALHVDDLADAEAPRRIVDAAVAAFGKLDAIVNNAAWIVRSNLDTTDAALFDRCMAVNVRAPMLLIQAAMPHLQRRRGIRAEHRLDQRLQRRVEPARVQPLEGRADDADAQPRRCATAAIACGSTT